MKIITRVTHALKKVPTWYWVVGALAIVLVWFFFFKPSTSTAEMLVLATKDLAVEVSVAGTVVASQEVDLGFTQSGRITSVTVRPGSRVSVGTTLATIESGELRAVVLQRQAAVDTQLARLDALKAGTRPEEIAIAESAVQSDLRGLIDDIKDAQRAADSAVHNTVDQFISNPRTNPQINFVVSDSSLKSFVEARRFSAETMLSAWGLEVSALTSSSDVVAAAIRAQTNLSAITSLLVDANAAVNRGITNPQTSQANLDAYSASLSTARTNVNASAAAISTGISQVDASKKSLLLKQAGSTPQDIAAQEAQVKAAQADVVAAQAQLSKTVISAPFSGTVTTVDAKVGKIVSPNTPEITMISSGTFQIESYIPEIVVSKLEVGQKAVVYLDAYGKEETFSATVISIAPASEARDGVPTYKTVLQFSAADVRIRSGMTADLSIQTDIKKDVIVIPQGALVRRGDKVFVTVKSEKEFIEREVQTGLTSIGEVEIISGLSVGEVIVLNPTK